jgi:hypothetical protein
MSADCLLYNPKDDAVCSRSCLLPDSTLDSCRRVETAFGPVFITSWKGTDVKEMHWCNGLPDADARQRVCAWMKSEGFFDSIKLKPVARELFD